MKYPIALYTGPAWKFVNLLKYYPDFVQHTSPKTRLEVKHQ